MSSVWRCLKLHDASTPTRSSPVRNRADFKSAPHAQAPALPCQTIFFAPNTPRSVLMVIAESQEPELQQVRDAGADGILIKPVTPDALLREVQRCLDQTSVSHQTSPHNTAHRRRPQPHVSVEPTAGCIAFDADVSRLRPSAGIRAQP